MSRPALLDRIQGLVQAALVAGSCTPQEHATVLFHIDKYRLDRNCVGNVLNGPLDCAPPGASNCPCLEQAMAAAQVNDWNLCITKMVQGH